MNAADAPSRGQPYNNVVDEQCRAILVAQDLLVGKVSKQANDSPAFTGMIRHEEPSETWDDWMVFDVDADEEG